MHVHELLLLRCLLTASCALADTATIASVEAHPLPYYLNEEKSWSFDESSVADALKIAADKEMPVKALVVINPGNPTGNCLSEQDMEAIIRVCYDNNIVLLADEVYQENVFDPENKPFHSFKKVLSSMGGPYATDVGLISFHSISKGYSGECGRRGGFMELVNIDEDVLTQINKISSVGLCPPASGQIGVDCLVRPPKEGGPSYAQWREETEGIKNALRDRSLFMGERFAKLDGMSCQKAEVRSLAYLCSLTSSDLIFALADPGRHVPLPPSAAAREGDQGRQGGRAVARPLLLPRAARCVSDPSPSWRQRPADQTSSFVSLQRALAFASSPATVLVRSTVRSTSGRPPSARVSKSTRAISRSSTRISWPSTPRLWVD